jgi:hypothetical protein
MVGLCLTLALAGVAGAQDGKILFEYWEGIDGTAVSALTGNANYPDNPTSSTLLDSFASPADRADYYGVRARAYLTAPESGEYTFWVSGDDYCQLWLSTDETAANATMIAQVAGWTNVAEWTKYAAQQSTAIALTAGQKYYIEALMKEGNGGDSLSVGWAGPGVGDVATVIAGQYCSAYLRLQARVPNPADGAADVTTPIFAWVAGDTAVASNVYVGTTPDLTEADLQYAAWGQPMIYFLGDLNPASTYYWRVDGVDAGGNVITGNVWSFTVQPMTASAPSPADAAENVGTLPSLSWRAGQAGILHMVYLSTDQDLVTAGDTSALVASQAETSFTPAAELDALSTYYWRVDEVDSAGAVIAGPVWSFATIDYIAILDAATALTYDNTVEPYVSSLDVNTPADLTAGGATSDLEIRFLGRIAPTGPVGYDEATGTYALTGTGADIWGTADAFCYTYKSLNGDGAMVARVVSSGTGSDNWSKGGVMIRQSLAAGSTHAYMPVTGGNGASFQRRLAANGDSSSYDDGTGIKAPYWVKVERTGTSFTGSVSADGVEWKQLGDPITIAMTDPVFIGLAVTSHLAGEYRTFTFDNVSTTGDITPEGVFTSWDAINVATNDAASIGVSLQDAAGNVAAVVYDDPAATQAIQWTTWKVPFSAFSGVDLTNVVSLQFAVGDGQPGGAGVVTFDNIRTVLPTETVVFFEDFESYVAGSDLHGQGGWKGWQGDAAAGSPASNARAFAGANSVEIIGSADLVHEFPCNGGVVTLTAMQYIPSGTAGTTYFILMNQYDDPGTALDWSVQTNFDLAAGVVNFDGGATAAIVYDKWVELKCVIDLDNNSVQLYYDGVAYATNQWDNDGHTTFQAIDLYGNNASSVWYDDIKIVQ